MWNKHQFYFTSSGHVQCPPNRCLNVFGYLTDFHDVFSSNPVASCSRCVYCSLFKIQPRITTWSTLNVRNRKICTEKLCGAAYEPNDEFYLWHCVSCTYSQRCEPTWNVYFFRMHRIRTKNAPLLSASHVKSQSVAKGPSRLVFFLFFYFFYSYSYA